MRISQFFLPPQPPLVFIDRSYRDLSSSSWNPRLGGLAWCWDARSQGIPPNFYPSQFLSITHECGTTYSATSPHLSVSLSLLPIWVNATSLNPWLLDFHTARFSDESGLYLLCSLVVIFDVVVWRGKACLSTAVLDQKSYQLRFECQSAR